MDGECTPADTHAQLNIANIAWAVQVDGNNEHGMAIEATREVKLHVPSLRGSAFLSGSLMKFDQ